MYYGSNTQRDWSLTPVDLLVWGFSQHPAKLKQELASLKDRVIILLWARQYGYVVVCVVSVAKLAFACLFYLQSSSFHAQINVSPLQPNDYIPTEDQCI